MSTTAKPTSRRRSFFRKRSAKNQFLFWTRRAHLYLGLFLIPWVMVYAITGFLFNHRSAFPERSRGNRGNEFESFSGDVVKGTPLEGLPSATEMAERVTAALNRKASAPESQQSFKVIDSNTAHFGWHVINTVAMVDGKPRRVDVELGGKGGDVFGPPPDKLQEAAFVAPAGVFVEPSFTGQIEQGVPAVLVKLGIQPDDKPVTIRRAPELVFNMAEGEKIWRVRYDPLSGSVAADEVESPEGLAWQRYLKILHFSVGFTGGTFTRWIWALFVDSVVLCLAFWCASGVIMWWQLRTVRRSGLLVLGASLAIAGLLGVAMYGNLLG